ELLDAIETAAPESGKRIVSNMMASRNAWSSMMRQIAHIQDPREQGQIFANFSALGGAPSDTEVENVFGRWRNDVKNVSTPAGLVLLIRALAAWDLDRARDVAARIPVDRLRARFKAGAKYDLDWCEALLGTLYALQLADLANPILDGIEAIDLSRLTRV